MASIYDVKEAPTDNSLKTSMDDRGYVTATCQRSFTIALDNGSSDNAVTVKFNATDLPRYNDAHPSSYVLRVDNVDVTRVSNNYYTATVSYRSPARKESEDPDAQPWELPVDITWDSVVTEEPIDVDVNGDAIANTNTNEPIAGLTRPITDLQGTFRKNMLLFDPTAIVLYGQKTNSDTFLGFAPGVAKVQTIAATNAIKADVAFWSVTVVIQFRYPYGTIDADKVWRKRVIRQGYREAFGGTVGPAYVDGVLATSPVLLDSNGYQLEPGAAPQFIDFQVLDSIAFSGLGLT